MQVLGICHDVWIASACLVADGEVVAAVAEERLDRVKRSRGFPVRAVGECLRLAGLDLSQVDEIAVAWNPARELATTPAGYRDGRRWRSEHLLQVPAHLLRLADEPAGDTLSLRGLWPDAPPVTYVDHHLAHLAAAFFLSPFDEAAAITLDGRGERQTSVLARGVGLDLQILAESLFPHSLGLVYGAVTEFLGFRPDADEWKVMALAGLADADNEFRDPMRRLVSVDRAGRLRVDLDAFAYYNFADPRWYSDRFVERFGPARKPDEPIEARHTAIAAALQDVFSDVVAALCDVLHGRTGLDRLVAAGGCFMNSRCNGRLAADTPFRDVFIGGAPDDSGTSVGAALWRWTQATGRRPKPACGHHFWGTGHTDDECRDVARRHRLPGARQVADPAARAAGDLARGRLVGWFQGRAEFGQRALGNRSILADPRDARMKDQVNRAVKFRESFRPFAPAVLLEHVHEWFDCAPGTALPYMECVLPFRPERTALIPAVVHADGTGRVQTVGPHGSPRFRALLEAFHAATGVPLVLNTSFNQNGEPIVNGLDDAIRTFYTCGLDVLYLGATRIAKEPDGDAP